MPSPSDKPTLTVREIASILRCSERTAYRMLTEDTWPTIQVGKRRVVPTARFREWLQID